MSQQGPIDLPFGLGALPLRNRAVVAPMSRVSAGAGGVPTPRLAEYYAGFARGGFGLVITEGVYTDQLYSQAYDGQPGLVTPGQIDGWRVVTRAVHDAGGRVLAQLMHAGALSQCRTATIAPSVVRPRGEKMPAYGGEGAFPMPAAATDTDLKAAIDGFAAAALAAREAGFDGVEIHGANGYLLDQFLTGYTNLRDDRYGGDAAARATLAAEVVDAVRRATDREFVVGIRLSQTKVNDFDHRWADVAEATAILRTVTEPGPDYLHIAGEGRNWRTAATLPGGPTITRLAREVTSLPVIANGGLHDPAQAAEVLSEGDADLVSIGRGALVTPDWPRRVRDGLPLRPWDPALLSPAADLASQHAWQAKN
ncbi:NADH:flavin oxidoreductase [Amycolatopsis acidicola]|uniref:NADH:flavin oxidoreductase n=1 Tax=Amycolatopsis acidicola TaxID=2596893 RepID=A0A5N0V280_9PSEU|nr:NADH:flavin oxidoreductase [Amycolatopsis acidicola]KAA9160537.1 NADH:flavin oxidoreductase [Amycolatopsis acidicola]